MRKTLIALTALTAIIGSGAASHTAKASPVEWAPAEPTHFAPTLLQPVQFYGDPRAEAWRREHEEREWRRREWERRQEAEHWRHHNWDRW